jgi:hypothetical protein
LLTDLETKIIRGALAIHGLCLLWHFIEWFFHAEGDLLHGYMDGIIAESKNVGHGLVGYSRADKCRLPVVNGIPRTRPRRFEAQPKCVERD